MVFRSRVLRQIAVKEFQGTAMDEEGSKACAYAERLLSVAIDVVGAAVRVQIDGNWSKHIQLSGGAPSRARK
jgi:hypothetical protein